MEVCICIHHGTSVVCEPHHDSIIGSSPAQKGLPRHLEGANPATLSPLTAVTLTMQVNIAVEFLLSWMARLRNEHQIVPFIAAMSIYHWHNGTQQEPWRAMQFMRLVYNREWTKKFAMEMSDHLPPPRYPVSPVVYCESADNDFVLVRLALQRVGSSHHNVDMIQRIQWAPRETAASTALAGVLQNPYVRPADNLQSLFQQYDPALCLLDQHLIKSCTMDVLRHVRVRVTSRPPGVQGNKSWKKYLRPMAATSAAAVSDISRYLNKVIDSMTHI
jgi:hypothetical protein